jgi:hypothetical protein
LTANSVSRSGSRAGSRAGGSRINASQSRELGALSGRLDEDNSGFPVAEGSSAYAFPTVVGVGDGFVGGVGNDGMNMAPGGGLVRTNSGHSLLSSPPLFVGEANSAVPHTGASTGVDGGGSSVLLPAEGSTATTTNGAEKVSIVVRTPTQSLIMGDEDEDELSVHD